MSDTSETTIVIGTFHSYDEFKASAISSRVIIFYFYVFSSCLWTREFHPAPSTIRCQFDWLFDHIQCQSKLDK